MSSRERYMWDPAFPCDFTRREENYTDLIGWVRKNRYTRTLLQKEGYDNPSVDILNHILSQLHNPLAYDRDPETAVISFFGTSLRNLGKYIATKRSEGLWLEEVKESIGKIGNIRCTVLRERLEDYKKNNPDYLFPTTLKT